MKRKQLNNATKEELLTGAKYCIENAQSLFESGKSIGEISNYGHGCSMLVLSIEEAVKCLVLIAKFFEIEVPESAVKVFYDHKYKHGQGKEIQPLLSTIQWISDNINALKSKSKNLVIELGILFLLPNILDRIFKVNDTQRDWWLSANDLKNNGLYVSFVDDAWKTPKAIDSSTFNSTLEIARSFVEILAVIEKLQPEDHRVITGGQFNEDLRSTNDKL